jgi:hypothetical protein
MGLDEKWRILGQIYVFSPSDIKEDILIGSTYLGSESPTNLAYFLCLTYAGQNPNRRRDDQKGLHDCRRLHHVHAEAAQRSRQAICSIIA